MYLCSAILVSQSVKIKEVISTLEQFAPLPLQESFDNAGLQIGLTEADVSGVLLCLDVTEAIVSEAIEKGCNMIVSHHPLLFHGLKQISDSSYVERAAVMAIKHDIAIVSMHTNLDNADEGVNSEIGRRLGLEGSVTEGLFTGEFPEPMSAREYIELVKKTFGAEVVMTNGLLERPIRRVAICGGAGAFMLQRAIEEGTDAFLTGEMKYNDYFDHDGEIMISVIGHYESEQFTRELLKDIIDRGCPEVRTIVTEHNTNPIRYY